MLKTKSIKSKLAWLLKTCSEYLAFAKTRFVVIGVADLHRRDTLFKQCSFYLAGKDRFIVSVPTSATAIENWIFHDSTFEKRKGSRLSWILGILCGKILLLKDTALARRLQSIARGKFFLVDSSGIYRLSAWRWASIFGDGTAATYRSRFAKLSADSDRVVVLGTGPSAELVFEDKYAGLPIITCNSAIKSKRLRDRNIFALCVCDPLYYLSPTAYYSAFRNQLQSWIAEKSGPALVVPASHAEVCRRINPWFPPERLCGVITSHHLVPSFNFLNNPATGDSNSVLTALMLPTAATFFREITLIGFDGRAPGVDYFWKHNDEFQFIELLESVKEYDRAFFSQKNGDIYARHSDTFAEELRSCLTALHAIGCVVSMEHPSFIAPLSELYESGKSA